jgi:hypothetical protein
MVDPSPALPDATGTPRSRPPAPARRQAGRRRQRSVRVGVAATLLALATLAVLLALPTQSAGWLSVSSVTALGCGWAAVRIVYSELVQSRREAAADRAAQAAAYRDLFARRAAEHADFTAAMIDRLTRSSREATLLGDRVVGAERRAADAEHRAAEAETRVQREARRVVEAQDVVHGLTARLALLEAEAAERAARPGDVPAAPARV